MSDEQRQPFQLPPIPRVAGIEHEGSVDYPDDFTRRAMPDRAPLHGWFCLQQAERLGTFIYRRLDGTTVEVTMVSKVAEQHSAWPDVTYQGLVTTCVGRGLERASRITAQQMRRSVLTLLQHLQRRGVPTDQLPRAEDVRGLTSSVEQREIESNERYRQFVAGKTIYVPIHATLHEKKDAADRALLLYGSSFTIVQPPDGGPNDV